MLKKKVDDVVVLKKVVAKLNSVDASLEGIKQLLLDMRESIHTALRRAHLEYGVSTTMTSDQKDRAIHPKRTKKFKRKEHHEA